METHIWFGTNNGRLASNGWLDEDSYGNYINLIYTIYFTSIHQSLQLISTNLITGGFALRAPSAALRFS